MVQAAVQGDRCGDRRRHQAMLERGVEDAVDRPGGGRGDADQVDVQVEAHRARERTERAYDQARAQVSSVSGDPMSTPASLPLVATAAGSGPATVVDPSGPIAAVAVWIRGQAGMRVPFVESAPSLIERGRDAH